MFEVFQVLPDLGLLHRVPQQISRVIGYKQRDIAAGEMVLLLAQTPEGGVLPEQVLGADAAHGEDDLRL